MSDQQIEQQEEEVAAAAPPADGEDKVDDERQSKARRMGWVPKEEFRGDPSRWMDHERFLEWSEKSLPIQRERYDALDRKFSGMERELGETKTKLTEAASVITDLRDLASRAEQRAFQR